MDFRKAVLSTLAISQHCETCRSRALRVAGVDEGYVYLDTWEDGLRVVTVRDPLQPREIGQLELEGANWAIAAADGSIYVVSRIGDSSRLLVIDVAEPTRPREVGSLGLPGVGSFRLIVADGYAYVASGACGESGCQGRLAVIDVTDPTRPRRVGDLEIPGAADVAVAGGYAYVASELCYYTYPSCSGELRVIDITDPTEPRQVSRLRLSPGGRSVAVAEDHVYVLGATRLHMVDVRDPARPREAGTFDWGGLTIEAAGRSLYVAGEHAGLVILRLPPSTSLRP